MKIFLSKKNTEGYCNNIHSGFIFGFKFSVYPSRTIYVVQQLYSELAGSAVSIETRPLAGQSRV
jgi:hypothetical protein